MKAAAQFLACTLLVVTSTAFAPRTIGRLRASSPLPARAASAARASPLARTAHDRPAVRGRAPAWARPFQPLARPALLATLIATLLVAGQPEGVDAAVRSGGRIGGRSPSYSSRNAPRSSVRSYAAPRSTVNIHVSPPPMIGGYGGVYGARPLGFGSAYGYGYGGTYVQPLAGLDLGLSVANVLLREQARQAYLQQQIEQQRELGRDEAMIRALQTQLAEQDAKIEALQAKAREAPGAQLAQPAAK